MVKSIYMKLCVFLQAKDTAAAQDKWLLINLQSTKEFSSHMVGCLSSLFGDNYFILYGWTKFLVFVYCFLKLNRDTWANEAVSQTISTNFIFWQVGSLFWFAFNYYLCFRT